MAASSNLTLARRIQNLAQELQDLIFDCTVAIEPGQVITIYRDYRPPAQLQISSRSRKLAARQYYSTSIFLVSDYDEFGCPGSFWRACLAWLAVLPRAHVWMIQQVRIPLYDYNREWVEEEHLNPTRGLGKRVMREYLMMELEDFSDKLKFDGIELAPAAFKVDWLRTSKVEREWLDMVGLENIEEDGTW